MAQVMAQVSPELVLVDPELALAARAQLPDPGHFFPAPRAHEAPAPDPAWAPTAESFAERRLRESGPRRHGGLAAAVSLVVFGFGIVLGTHLDRGDRAAAPAAQARPTVSNPEVAGPAPKPVVRPSRPTRKKKEPERPRPSRVAPRKRAFVPSRTWAWPPVEGARFYRAVFVRGRRTVYEARTTEPRLVLRAGFRFTPGRYRWSVVPGFGRPSKPRYGKPVVQSAFDVSKKS
jgi:hypothetical protein